MAKAGDSPQKYYDSLASFEAGINSGIEPLLLLKNQLAFAMNATMRGGYIRPRPAIQNLVFDFAGDTALESAVTEGFFQGAGHYRPDFGSELVIAQITGRLFQFTITGNNAVVSEITIPGDPNDATANQVWTWQSEKWLIINDGTGSLPIFFDGVSCRRSYGPSAVLGSVTALSQATPPAIGSIIQATLAAAYTGPFNVPLLFNHAYYQAVQNAGPTPSYNATLTNLAANPGDVMPIGSQLVIRPSVLANVTANATAVWGSPITVDVSTTFGMTVGLLITVTHLGVVNSCGVAVENFKVLSVNSSAKQVTLTPIGSSGCPPGIGTQTIYKVAPFFPGLKIQLSITGGSAPNVIVGNTTAVFTVPAVGATVAIILDNLYSGPSGQTVWIGTDQYSIAATPPTPPGTTLNLVNISDTTTAAITLPQDILSVPELPAGRMGAYGLGQNWMSLTDGLSFIVSDPVGGASGTQANNYRDAVLKYTELTFRGGSFRIPTSGNIITSMTFTATLDVSLGQGPLEIGTDQGMFSCIAPVDFTQLPNINGPILTASMLGYGPLAQNATILANSDILFRWIEGLGSLVIARRSFGEWGNTPISQEMDRVFGPDNRTLLSYGSAVVHNNRFLVTAMPVVSPRGVVHQGIVALNFDLISNLRGKLPPCYDGLWTGLNVLQSLTGLLDNTRHSFFFTVNQTANKIELSELKSTGGKDYFDNGTDRIQFQFETPVIFNKDVHDLNGLLRLTNGEFMVRNVVGKVDFTVEYRPDFYPCWVPWSEFSICADTGPENSQPGYRTRLGLGEPSSVPCEAANNRPLRVGHFFQMRYTIIGQCEWMGQKIEAVTEPVVEFASPICIPLCDPDFTVP